MLYYVAYYLNPIVENTLVRALASNNVEAKAK